MDDAKSLSAPLLPFQDAVHVCVDMQRLFGPGSPWAVPWLETVVAPIASLVARQPARTIFTRFIPPPNAESATGTWQHYYREWPDLTRDRLPREWLDLADPFIGFVPPARVVDKSVYSPWLQGGLDTVLAGSGVGTIVISGGESEICVLATVLGAIDRGYRVILASDGLCSAFDQTHDAVMQIYRQRFSVQLRIAPIAEIILAWQEH